MFFCAPVRILNSKCKMNTVMKTLPELKNVGQSVLALRGNSLDLLGTVSVDYV